MSRRRQDVEPNPNPDPNCPDCEGTGVVIGFEDRFSHASGHYTVDVAQACECSAPDAEEAGSEDA